MVNSGFLKSFYQLAAGPGAFRVLLALMVVISHVTRFDIGRPAVMAFFILSGYWVGRMYHEKYAQQRVTLFYASRFFRIWPLYAASLLIAGAVYAMIGERARLPSLENFYLFGVAGRSDDPLGVSWSLDIELQFYALLPLMVAVMAWAGGNRGKNIALGIAGAALFAAGTFLQWRYGVWTVFAFLPAFIAGYMIYRLSLFRSSNAAGPRAAVLSALLFLGAGIAMYLMPATKGLLIKTIEHPFPGDWFAMGWAALLIPFIAWNVRQKSTRLDRRLGDYSYSLYLVHFPVVLILRETLALDGAAMKLLAIITGLIAAALLQALIDRPLERWRRKMLAEAEAKSAAPIAQTGS